MRCLKEECDHQRPPVFRYLLRQQQWQQQRQKLWQRRQQPLQLLPRSWSLPLWPQQMQRMQHLRLPAPQGRFAADCIRAICNSSSTGSCSRMLQIMLSHSKLASVAGIRVHSLFNSLFSTEPALPGAAQCNACSKERRITRIKVNMRLASVIR